MTICNRRNFAWAATIVLLVWTIYGLIKIDTILKEHAAYINEQATREQALLDAGFFRIDTLESFPRPSLIQYYCGSVEHVVTYRNLRVAENPVQGNGFVLFCKNDPATNFIASNGHSATIKYNIQ